MSYNPNASGTPAVSNSAANDAANNTGLTLTKGTPVRVSGLGMSTINVSVEAQANAIAGVVRADTSDSTLGAVVSNGIIQDITTSASVGDVLYVSKTGTTTNVKPSIGTGGFVADDWVVRVGVVAKNSGNPSLKDLLVILEIVGKL